MTERNLDGGSASPPTADVPTEDRAIDLRTPARWLNDPEFAGIEILDYDGWRGADWQAPITVQEFRRRLCQCTITGPVRRSADHSGVAGEPEATTKEASESAQDVGPTPTHAPTPETPGAVNVAGGVVIQVQVVDISAACRERVGDAWREMYPGMAEHDYRLRFTRPGGWEVTMRRGATAEDVVRNLRESRD